jgi:hypothetical protein
LCHVQSIQQNLNSRARSVIGNWQMAPKTVPERFVAYAWAYLHAATRMCEAMKANPAQYKFPDASVVLLLSAHSVELFLKGAILRRNSSFGIVTHCLDKLKREYDRLYPDTHFRWEIPFGTEYVGIPEHEAMALAKEEVPPSIRFRYPTDQKKMAWSGIHGFTPSTFLHTLKQVNADYVRIEGMFL